MRGLRANGIVVSPILAPTSMYVPASAPKKVCISCVTTGANVPVAAYSSSPKRSFRPLMTTPRSPSAPISMMLSMLSRRRLARLRS